MFAYNAIVTVRFDSPITVAGDGVADDMATGCTVLFHVQATDCAEAAKLCCDAIREESADHGSALPPCVIEFLELELADPTELEPSPAGGCEPCGAGTARRYGGNIYFVHEDTRTDARKRRWWEFWK